MSKIIIHWSNGDQELIKNVSNDLIEKSKRWIANRNNASPYYMKADTASHCHHINLDHVRKIEIIEA